MHAYVLDNYEVIIWMWDQNFSIKTFAVSNLYIERTLKWSALNIYLFKAGTEWDRSNLLLGFPGGAVIKNPPANAGDTGSIPGQERSHMPQSNKTCVPQLLSLCSRAREPQLLSPRATITEAHTPRAHALQQEKPPQ